MPYHSPVLANNRDECYYYKNGHCRDGNNCDYAHCNGRGNVINYVSPRATRDIRTGNTFCHTCNRSSCPGCRGGVIPSQTPMIRGGILGRGVLGGGVLGGGVLVGGFPGGRIPGGRIPGGIVMGGHCLPIGSHWG